MVYELDFLVELEEMNLVFHISLLNKCGWSSLRNAIWKCGCERYLSYKDIPVEILNLQVRGLRNNEVASVKVLWRSQSVEGATWEAEEAIKAKFLFSFLVIHAWIQT